MCQIFQEVEGEWRTKHKFFLVVACEVQIFSGVDQKSQLVTVELLKWFCLSVFIYAFEVTEPRKLA